MTTTSWEANSNRRRRVITTQVYDGVNPCIRREGSISANSGSLLCHVSNFWCKGIKTTQTYYCSTNLIELKKLSPQASQVALVEKAPIFACPICMDELVEEISTKCGHIFCGSRIATALANAKRCHTCRRKLTTKDTFRIFLPTRS
ncbi:hypothetical protein Pfo_026682 [Paulownia fortunei]|nr:hypothetical protein Pfo_026682 [Paulownia fortunei]